MKCRRPNCTRRATPRAAHRLCPGHAHVAGVENPYIDATVAQEQVAAMRRAGWTMPQIADETGLGLNTVKRLDARAYKRVRTATARAIHAAAPLDPPPGHLVDAMGVRRRLRSLQAAGWSLDRLCDYLDMSRAAVWCLTSGSATQTLPSTDRTIRAAWDALHMQPVGKPTSSARKHGWPVPMAWEDIDDPDEEPGVTHCLHCASPVKAKGMCHPCYDQVRARQRKAEKVA